MVCRKGRRGKDKVGREGEGRVYGGREGSVGRDGNERI